MKSSVLFILILGFILFSGCIGQRMEKQAEEDEQIILDYIQTNNLSAEKHESGLYYVIDQQGSGIQPNINSEVTVAYKGYLADNSVFDESDTSGVTFGLNQVIEGWQIGIPLFQEGGKGMLLIPSELGYGSSDRPGIPKNSVLIFDIHLIEVN